MTYDEVMQIVRANNPFMTQTFNPEYDGLNRSQPLWFEQTTPGVFLREADNPAGGFVQDGGDGTYTSYMPRDGGLDAVSFDAQGNVVRQEFLTSPHWHESLTRAALTLGLPAVAMNALPALMGNAATGTAGATSGAAVGGGTASGTAGTAGATGGASLSELIAAQGLPPIGPVESIAETAARFGAPAVAPSGSASSGMPSMPSGMMDWVRQNAPWLIPALGAGAAIAGNDDITQTQTTSGSGTQGLAPWLDTYARDFVGRAQELSTAPASNATMDAGRGLLTDYATQGDPLVNAARAQQQDVIGGGLLNSNPYIDQLAQNIGNRMGDAYAVGTRANTASRFNNDGNSVGAKSAFGQTNFMNDRAFADSLGSTMNNLYFGNYQQERAAQDAASRGSLGFGQFGVNNAQGLYNAGAMDWQRPFAQNQQFGQAINPAFGSATSNTGTQNQTINAPNSWMAGLGGAAMGAGIWNMFNPQRRP